MGWPMEEIAIRVGVCRTNIGDILRQERVRGPRAAMIARIFDDLHMIPGPSKHATQFAKAKGWLPPLAWDEDTIDDPASVPDLGRSVGLVVDESAVVRMLAGERISVNLHERRAALAMLCGQDLTAPQIAERIGCSTKTVERFRKANREVGR